MNDNINIPDSNITTNLTFRQLVLMNMQQLTNFPYIENDFDALTDYELLCLVVKFLNDVIANQNEQNDSITRMYNSFLALQDYVNNTKDELEDAFNDLNNYVRDYFANLDVQDEINNKLDEMLESGALEQIIEQFLRLTALICFDSVDDMKLSINLTNGSYAQTLGFYEKGDEGSALYKIRKITNDDVINNMDIIEMSDSSNELIAELVSDKNNIFCYGVTADDSNNNNADIINYVIEKYSYVYSDKDFTINDTIEINDINKQFDFTNITYTGNNVGVLVNNHDIIINGNTLSSSNDGIKLGNDTVVLNCKININRINAEHDGITIGGSAGVQGTTFNINQINYKNHGVYFDLYNSYAGQLTFYGTNFTDLSNIQGDNFAIYMDTSQHECTGLTMYNVSFEGSKGGIFVTSSTFKYLEHLHIYGARLAEMSFNHNKKALKLVSGDIGNNVKGNFDFDMAQPSAFDLTEYHAYSRNALEFNGAFRTALSEDLFSTKAVANYGGIVFTEHSRGCFYVAGNDQVLTKLYDQIFVGSGTGTSIKFNNMPDVNQLNVKPVRIYINSDLVTKIYIVAKDTNQLRYEASCARDDIFEFYPSAIYTGYGYDGYVVKYKKSDNSISTSRVAANY